MKLVKLIILFVIISLVLSYQETRKKKGLKSLKRVDQKSSGICGFVGVLEVALDYGVAINGKSSNDEFQDYLPSFIEDSLTYLKANKKSAFDKIFSETQEFMVTFMNKKLSKWYKTSERMLQNVKDRMLKTSDYSRLLGLFLSFDNLKEVAEYSKVTIDSTRGSQTKLSGSLNLEITIDNLKNLKSCIIGLSNSVGTVWKSTDSLYNADLTKNKATQHWIYVTKDEKLKNWGQTGITKDEYDVMIQAMKDNDLNIISEALCFN